MDGDGEKGCATVEQRIRKTLRKHYGLILQDSER